MLIVNSSLFLSIELLSFLNEHFVTYLDMFIITFLSKPPATCFTFKSFIPFINLVSNYPKEFAQDKYMNLLFPWNFRLYWLLLRHLLPQSVILKGRLGINDRLHAHSLCIITPTKGTSSHTEFTIAITMTNIIDYRLGSLNLLPLLRILFLTSPPSLFYFLNKEVIEVLSLVWLID